MKPLDVKKVNAAFNSQSWLFGLASDYVNVDTLPSAAGQFRLLAMGEMHLVMVSEAKWKALMPACLGIEEVVGIFGKLDSAKVTDGMKAAPIYAVTMKAGDALWIPPGFIVASRCTRGPVIYGIRKSIFTDSKSSKSNLEGLISLMDTVRKPTDRLKQVVELFDDSD